LGSSDRGRQLYGDQATLGKCRGDKKFAYVTALARAMNALNSAHSLMAQAAGLDTPAAQRDRMNASLFVSGILYETLKLIRKMSHVFKGDANFNSSLGQILRDASGQELEQLHLKAVRHGGVFHFLPEEFEKSIAKTPLTECIFLSSGAGEKEGLHYEFADWMATEIMIGPKLDDPVIWEMMRKMLDLVLKLNVHSEKFITDQLRSGGFRVRDFRDAPKSPQSQRP
jgi:hypothetical protein